MKEYSPEIQKLFLEMMLQDAVIFVRVQNIYNPENFDKTLRETARFIKQHSADYKTLPAREQIKATTGVDLKPIEEMVEGHYEWFLDEFESFTRKQELERAILQSADLIEKGNFDPVEKLIKDAVQISLTKDMGTDYFEDPRARLMKIKANNGQVSTGWSTMDARLFGGMNRGELNIFAGGSGSGKSLFMQNIALNWLQQGLNGVFLTLELSEELTAMRLDAMAAGMSTKEVFKDLDTLEMKIKILGKKSGKLRIKYMPAQSNVNQIRAYLKELEVQTGMKTDFIMVDYLDLVMPVSAKVSPSDLFVKDKYVSEELRNLAREFNILMITASQLNRSAVEEVEFDHSHISGGISKINTADNVFGIFTSRAMKERGRYQIQLMKTRSSSGVGTKVDLEFNMETLRITDPGEDGQSDSGASFSSNRPTSSIMSQIKSTSSISPITAPTPIPKNPSGEEKKIIASVNSSKLTQMLNDLKTKP
ncbi:41 helicase [uncultured Caudovirales phage]|uniref:41 helicase n=1 Tax=uncultured Caudovirales phage TaxID=2100421 RepID=A0A6J5LJR6_9CAUD|nr:41 helicase [uncultured Caudovirales phage]